MATIRISEAEAARDFAGLMARVRAGTEVVIDDASPTVRLSSIPARQPGRLLSEAIALAEARGSAVTLDQEFARDLEAVIDSHRDALNPPAWD